MPAVARRVAVEHVARDLLVGLVQSRVVEAELRRQPAEDLAVRQARPGRLDGRQVERHVVVPVGVVDVEVLRLHRRRQDDVGIQRGVGHPLLEHDREQILAREAGVHARVIGVAGGGVRVEDDERRDGRVVGLEQRLAEARHVDRARRRRAEVGRNRDAARADAAEMAARHAQEAAADVPEVTGQRGQCQDRAHRRAGAAVALQPEPEPDRRRPRVREAPPERDHALDRQAADPGRALDGPLGQARLELGPALGVALEPVAILGALVEHDAHEAERERGIRAGPRREMLVAAARGVRAQRVDRDDVRAGFLRGQHEAPLVEVRREQVGAPQQDQPRVLEVLGIHAHGAPVGGAQRGIGGGGADRRPEARGAHRREQPRPHDPALDHALGAGEVVRQHGLGAVPRDRRLQAGGGRFDRVVPADLLERPLALGAGAAQRLGHASGAVDGVEVAVDLGAQRAVGERVRAVAAQVDGAAVLDLDQPGAGVGAVQRAGSAHDRRHAPSLRPRRAASPVSRSGPRPFGVARSRRRARSVPRRAG